MSSMKKSILLCLSIVCITCTTASTVAAFSVMPLASRSTRSSSLLARTIPEDSKEYWLEEFATANGEILNPYNVLKIERKADKFAIKHAYREMSKRYHPDKQRYRDVLPGRCNDLEDVRDEWERVKLSYEILRDPRTRKRFDRHEVLADPTAAVGRAVAGAAFHGIAGGVANMFAFGAFAFDKMVGMTGAEQGENTTSS